MARTHSSYTASPTRTRSPPRSPVPRSSSEDGSQYEMDLDALGLNSTFESTAMEGSFEPPIDRVDTSDVEGPDDFTMNMTYWMTADLLPAQVRSRKEARRRGSLLATSRERPPGAEDESSRTEPPQPESQPVPEPQPEPEPSTAASPTVRVHGTTASRDYSTPVSDRSMAHDEKVRSFLSALPDTELDLNPDHLPTASPLRAPRHSNLRASRSSPLKARSLQPTVEDGDTPRKPTQQTVIHNPSPADHHDQSPPDPRIADLQALLEQQELSSRTRLTELETILSYTRSELDAARNDNYKHKEIVARLEQSAADSAQSKEMQLTQAFDVERTELQEKLAQLQSRADTFKADLARATTEAKAARQEAQARHARESVSKADTDHHLSRIASLEANLQDARFSLECAQTDAAAKAQLFQTNIQLNTDLRTLRNSYETQQAALSDLTAKKDLDSHLQSELVAKDQTIAKHVAERHALECQLSTAQGRISGLETSLASLRIQITKAHHDSGSARADAERLSQDLEDAKDALAGARAESDRRMADVEKKLAMTKELKREAENKFKELKSQHNDFVEGHEAILEDVRDKAEDTVRKTGSLLAQERKDKARLKKEVDRLQIELETLRATSEDSTILGLGSDVDEDLNNTAAPPPPQHHDNDADKKEIAALRDIIKTQVATIKSLKASHESAATSLKVEVAALKSRLSAQAADHAAINAAMDEQLAVLLSKLMKERARTVVGKRDGQWEQVQRGAAGEKELLGKVLMRQWGREECGASQERGKGKGQGQLFEYKYVERER